jgi:hypothetical protein
MSENLDRWKPRSLSLLCPPGIVAELIDKGAGEAILVTGIQGTVEDLERAARGVKAAREIVEGMEAIVDEFSRSAVVEFNNTTTRTLKRVAERADHGSWAQLPVDTIAPFAAAVFGSASSGFMTGTTTTVDYLLDEDGTRVHLYWEVPFIGGNSCTINVTGPSAAFYDAGGMIAGGNTKVRARFVVTEKALSAPTESDWRGCGDCKGLFYSLDEGRCPGKREITHFVRENDNVGSLIGQHRAVSKWGPHEGAGFTFRLPYGVPGPNREEGWVRCRHCRMLYFNLRDKKGRCPGGPGGGHVADAGSPAFILPHDVPVRAGQHDNWRFCKRCYVLFFWPHGADGNCAAGDKHDPHPFNYVLQQV